MAKWLALAQVRLADAYAAIRDREEGQGLTEYIVLVAAVIAMVIALVAVLTTDLSNYISSLLTNLPSP